MKRIILALTLAFMFVAFCADSCYIGPYQGGWTGQYSLDGTTNQPTKQESGPGTPGQCPADWYTGTLHLKLVPGTCH